MIEHVLARAAALQPRIDDGRRRASGGRAEGRAGGASGPHVCGAGATARHRARAADGRAGAAAARRARWSCCRATSRCCRPRRCRTLVDRHQTTGAAATVLTAVVDDPHGYGRIVRSGEQIARIVEEKDATPGRAGDPRDQLRHLRLRARRAVRRRPEHRRRERAEGVLPAGSRRRSTGSAGRRVETVTVAERRRDPRHQQPRRAGGQ